MQSFLEYVHFRDIGAIVFESAGQSTVNAIGVAFTVMGTLLAWLAYKAQPPKSRLKRTWSRFPVTTPPAASPASSAAKADAARWYHRIVVQNRGGLAATGPRITIKAPSPILAQRITPETGKDAFVPIPNPQNPDPSVLQLEAQRIVPGDRVLIELWTVAEEPPSIQIKSDEGEVRMEKIEDYPSRPSSVPISLIVGLGTIALVLVFYFIAQKL